MKQIMQKLFVRAIFFLALVAFSSAIAFVVALVFPSVFVFIPIPKTGMDLNELSMIVFFLVVLLLVMVNFNGNQRAADNCCKLGPPKV